MGVRMAVARQGERAGAGQQARQHSGGVARGQDWAGREVSGPTRATVC